VKGKLVSQKEKAEAFRDLHRGKRLFVLPNAWDVPSARIFENSGFPAIATSSAGMMVSLGYPDGEIIPWTEYLEAVRKIARVLSAPLSVDIVGGFGADAGDVASTIKGILEAGGIGINIEDFVHATKKLEPVEKEVGKLKAIQTQASSMGVPLVINARTDALRFAGGDDEAKLQEAIRRASAYRDAGADCVYPMGLTDRDSISRFVKELDCPVNVMIRKGLPTLQELENLGVTRVSFGPSASYAAMGLLKRISKEILESGSFCGLLEGAISIDELNSLAVPRKDDSD
jgi:2-methylisocitrate lyase-like PEP mutase family enzyme